jgi:hypothetical protein
MTSALVPSGRRRIVGARAALVYGCAAGDSAFARAEERSHGMGPGFGQRRLARMLMLETPYLVVAPTARSDRNR